MTILLRTDTSRFEQCLRMCTVLLPRADVATRPLGSKREEPRELSLAAVTGGQETRRDATISKADEANAEVEMWEVDADVREIAQYTSNVNLLYYGSSHRVPGMINSTLSRLDE